MMATTKTNEALARKLWKELDSLVSVADGLQYLQPDVTPILGPHIRRARTLVEETENLVMPKLDTTQSN